MPAIRPTLAHDVRVKDGVFLFDFERLGRGRVVAPPSTVPAVAHPAPPQTAEQADNTTKSHDSTATDATDSTPADTQSLTSQSLSEDLVRELR